MKKCKITVMRVTRYEDLMAQYENPISHACDMEEGQVFIIDVTTRQTVRLEEYDCIGFASGVYFGKFHDSVLSFARQYLPQGKPVFFVCTYGGDKGNSTKVLTEIAKGKDCRVLGEFGCKGYDTYGPFKLVGGIAKGHPNTRDLENARSFFRQMQDRLC